MTRGRAAGTAARRALHALLGAAVLLPYLGLGWVLVRTGQESDSALVTVLLTVPAVAGGLGVLVLPGVRELAVAAARTLLDACPLPDTPLPDRRTPRGGRLRGALWVLLGMAVGLLAASALLAGIPQAIGLITAPWVAYPGFPTGAGAWWAPILGPVLLLVAGAVPVLLGAAQARVAPWFLGPTPAERLADELDRTRRAAARDAEHARLARELHDSVGHALTVTTLQAGAAAELLDSDPAFARTALEAIARTGRAALDDLDHVLGLLHTQGADGTDGTAEPRESGPAGRDDRAPGGRGADRGGADGASPVRDLRMLDDLLDGARTAGLALRTDLDDLTAIPGPVSREIYRLVQEGLTNALRHGTGSASVTLRRTGTAVELTVRNPRRSRGGEQSSGGRRVGGRGLTGAADRVTPLGGTLTAGPDSTGSTDWVLHAVLPTAAPHCSDRTSWAASPARHDDDTRPAR
ncbi:sensor histidine kinase [Pseudonocardia phyllosphaerae]|uniref:sensor histidine kinase n=1 Tax=Pseudonocardia phyllosphaerae TaxID=3390502 RepID=UPI00397CC41B